MRAPLGAFVPWPVYMGGDGRQNPQASRRLPILRPRLSRRRELAPPRGVHVGLSGLVRQPDGAADREHHEFSLAGYGLFRETGPRPARAPRRRSAGAAVFWGKAVVRSAWILLLRALGGCQRPDRGRAIRGGARGRDGDETLGRRRGCEPPGVLHRAWAVPVGPWA